MNEQRRGVAVRDVEVRTWPQRVDLLIIDPYDALVLAYFPFVSPGQGKVADLRCGYTERARRALEQLEADQYFLRGHYQVAESEDMRLRATSGVRQLMTELLEEYGLNLDMIEFANLPSVLAMLRTRDADELYGLLCGWHDIVERHMPAGYTLLDPNSWVHRAGPQDTHHFHYLAAGLASRQAATAADSADAYALFRQFIDTELCHFSFGHALRWVYFHATEFADYEPFPLRALAEAAL